MATSARVRRILTTIAQMYPDAHCELTHSNPFELTIAVLLSAQCTDKTVNQVTATLFQKYKQPADYIQIPIAELETDIRRIGLFRNKAKHIQQLCHLLIDQYHGHIPQKQEQLMGFPGVGRKTANVIMATAFNVPALAVDTHVERIAKRLSLAKPTDHVEEVEQKLMRKIPRNEWIVTHHRFVFFGRYHCKAQSPNCTLCPLQLDCIEGKIRIKGLKSRNNKK